MLFLSIRVLSERMHPIISYDRDGFSDVASHRPAWHLPAIAQPSQLLQHPQLLAGRRISFTSRYTL